MSNSKSRASSDTDVDSHNLRNALNVISADLATPFLEKRARTKSHKNNPIEELNAVIQELTGRERELQAAVGISKMLLDRNDELVQKKKELSTKKSNYKASVKQYQQELENLKEELINADDKYQLVNNALVKSEDDQIKLLAENKRILYENSLKQINIENEPTDAYENEIIEIKQKFKEQYDSLISNYYIETKLENEKKIRVLEDSLVKSEKEKFNLMETVSKLERDLAKLSKKLKDQEELFNEVDLSRNDLEEKCREYNIMNVKHLFALSQ